jgi:hypothetical protein
VQQFTRTIHQNITLKKQVPQPASKGFAMKSQFLSGSINGFSIMQQKAGHANVVKLSALEFGS